MLHVLESVQGAPWCAQMKLLSIFQVVTGLCALK